MAHEEAVNNSFKVTVARKHKDKVMNGEFWQDGIGCRVFKRARKVRDQESEQK